MPSLPQALRQLADQAGRSSFNLVLIDINMPVMNGFEVLDKIRSSPALKYTPTVIMSTSDNPDQVEAAYKKGANSYIKKPISFGGYNELIKAIETCFLRVIKY
ncbi:response regulator [Spirosoma sp. KNUC1025]|uniref:response regulator n=1 Tax=Spirosoma sp. KNUC1025 TaxID=2894082 RepID=UPI00386EFD67|nr:response regulator [Spirosoma sp. KNUC1025]